MMKASLDCIFCMLDKAKKMYMDYEPDRNKRVHFIKSIMKMIAETDDYEIPPTTTARIQRELSRHAGISDHFIAEKKLSNEMALNIEDEIWTHISKADVALERAIQYALAGNIIDMAAYDEINENEVLSIVNTAATWEINQECFNRFNQDLKMAAYMVYLTDNAGEIVFDKLLIKVIQAQYPHIKMDVIVRGMPILNDATLEDAEVVGLTKIVTVTDNGTDIPGTDMTLINDEAKNLIQRADVILAKGMGNFESLYGNELNIYFAFLCKCKYFTERFKVETNTSMFLHSDMIQMMDFLD